MRDIEYKIKIRDVDERDLAEMELTNLQPEKTIGWAIGDIFNCSRQFITLED